MRRQLGLRHPLPWPLQPKQAFRATSEPAATLLGAFALMTTLRIQRRKPVHQVEAFDPEACGEMELQQLLAALAPANPLLEVYPSHGRTLQDGGRAQEAPGLGCIRDAGSRCCGVLVQQEVLTELVQLLERAVAAEARATAAEDSLRSLLRALVEAGRCPILLEPWRDPVGASDGYTYDRSAIEDWSLRHPTSPMTRELLRLPLRTSRFAAQVRQLLLQRGLDVGGADAPQAEERALASTALVGAIRRGQQARALRFLKRRSLPGLNSLSTDGASVLHFAIHQQLPEVAVGILLRDDFHSANSSTEQGETALHWAAIRGYLSVCQALLARPDFHLLRAARRDGRTALHLAFEQNHAEVANFLLSFTPEWAALISRLQQA